MKNNSNIYDIDGELIRASGDTHKWTIEEAQEKLKHYQDLLKELENSPEDTEKRKNVTVYTTYIRNIISYISTLYIKNIGNSKDALNKQENTAKTELKEQVENAINQLREEINDTDAEGNTTNEVQRFDSNNNESNTDKKLGNDEVIRRDASGIQEELRETNSSILGETTRPETIMDEYVDFEEVQEIDPVNISPNSETDGTTD